MSLIGVTQHNESIYNLIVHPKPPPPKPKRYHSIFGVGVRDEVRKVKKDHRTMGFAQEPVPRPNEFLKKKGGIKAVHPPDGSPRCLKETKHPPIPRRDGSERKDNKENRGASDDNPLPALLPPKEDKPRKRSYIRSNIEYASMAPTRKPDPYLTDTVRGDRFPLHTSGLMPKYVFKKTFGRIPQYIVKTKQEMEAEQTRQLESDKPQSPFPNLRQLDSNERLDLLRGMKQNYEELNRAFLRLPMLTDTVCKRMRKDQLEQAIRQLEKDIKNIEHHPVLFVAREPCAGR